MKALGRSKRGFSTKVVPALTDALVLPLEFAFTAAQPANIKLARSIADTGFGMLRQLIEYKAYLRGNTVIIADRFYPSSRLCSGCGQVHEITLKDRTLACDCGLTIDRDLNAAINLNR